ncbi:TPA: hypothetical protein ACSP88_002524 [Aeromonas hydrophila]
MSLNPLEPLHAVIAYYGITHTELSMLTREQLLSIIKGESSLLEEVFSSYILAANARYDEKIARHKEQALAH